MSKRHIVGNHMSRFIYCRLGIFAKILFSQIALKYVSYVKNSRLRQDLPISINDRVILPFREGLFSRNFAHAKFRENKILTKISEFTVF